MQADARVALPARDPLSVYAGFLLVLPVVTSVFPISAVEHGAGALVSILAALLVSPVFKAAVVRRHPACMRTESVHVRPFLLISGLTRLYLSLCLPACLSGYRLQRLS